MNRLLLPVVILSLASANLGCGSGGGASSLSKWQDNLDRFVELNRNDPNALRDETINNNRPGFGSIGADDPRRTTDVWGVLLAHQFVNQRPWFVYLVGVVKEQKVDDIRLAAVSFKGGKPTWRITKENKHALQEYQLHARNVWQKSHPSHAKEIPPEFTTFPRDADRFDFSAEGKHIDVTHTDSGAHWRIMLP